MTTGAIVHAAAALTFPSDDRADQQRHLKPHGFRYSFITQMLTRGITPQVVA